MPEWQQISPNKVSFLVLKFAYFGCVQGGCYDTKWRPI